MDANQIQWSPWAPRENLSPEFNIESGRLRISTGENPNSYGKFISGEIDIAGFPAVSFEAGYECENVKNEEQGVFAMINFYAEKNEKNVLLERSYADIVVQKSGEKKLQRKLAVPEGAAYATCEVGTRYCPNSTVEFFDISLVSAEAIAPRLVKIATTYKEPKDSLEQNLCDMLEIIDKAGKSNPDLILLSELVYETSYSDPVPIEQKAQPIPGPLTDAIGAYAKKYNAYIVFSMNELCVANVNIAMFTCSPHQSIMQLTPIENTGETIYNTAVVIGRDGKVCGKYRKTHLPLNEAEGGTSPGRTPAVFDLDFGRVGILICYDQMFPENARTLALMGAELILLPTMGEEEILQRAIARFNGTYLAVSGYAGPASSRIIDPLGEIICCVQDKECAYIAEEIDLNKRFFVYWMSVGAANGETRSLFIKERMTDTYGAIDKATHEILI
ncbi:MAG: carbon-nitrogen hydrolase family protein [Oscillospiraceae bacterium]|nr:carbon-nitrogen hydrolase family protein [Oscillospiraceae bacterium]